jgi:hypothetical protein
VWSNTCSGASIGGANPRCWSRAEQIRITEIKIEKGAILSQYSNTKNPLKRVLARIWPDIPALGIKSHMTCSSWHPWCHLFAIAAMCHLFFVTSTHLPHQCCHLSLTFSSLLSPVNCQCCQCCQCQQGQAGQGAQPPHRDTLLMVSL